jgi:hypothetical protein
VVGLGRRFSFSREEELDAIDEEWGLRTRFEDDDDDEDEIGNNGRLFIKVFIRLVDALPFISISVSISLFS